VETIYARTEYYEATAVALAEPDGDLSKPKALARSGRSDFESYGDQQEEFRRGSGVVQAITDFAKLAIPWLRYGL